MNLKRLRELQEKFNYSLELEEGLGGARDSSDEDRLRKRLEKIETDTENSLEKYRKGKARWQLQKKADQAQNFLRKHPKKKPSSQEESYNLYDILISHLLDEGYADDVKNAYVILENMSEDWAIQILDEKFISPFKGPPTSYKDITPLSPATKAMRKSDELQRTEPGSRRQKRQTRRSQQLNRMFQAARRA